MLPILSPTWEAPSPEKPALTWKSITDFTKPTLHLEDSGRKFGTDEESAKRHGMHGYGANCPAIHAGEAWIVYNRHA